MVSKAVIEATVRDTNNPTIKTARITSIQLLPFIGKKVKLTVEVIEDA